MKYSIFDLIRGLFYGINLYLKRTAEQRELERALDALDTMEAYLDYLDTCSALEQLANDIKDYGRDSQEETDNRYCFDEDELDVWTETPVDPDIYEWEAKLADAFEIPIVPNVLCLPPGKPRGKGRPKRYYKAS